MSERLPVNPIMLKWARESAGMGVEDVAAQLKRKRINAETVLGWERGEGSPTYPQLEEIAYKIYKRPLALFFFPEPPQEESPRESFRTLPDFAIEKLPKEIRLLIRKAKAMQINLSELYAESEAAQKKILRDLSFGAHISATEMAKVIRNYLGISLEEQAKWSDSASALKNWRNTLENYGIFIFKDAFRVEAFSGFCLYDEKFPIIYINNSTAKNRQIFTLFHELAHLLFRTGGIDTPSDDYLDYLEGDNKRIEILCNRFAGEFLVPSDDFGQKIRGIEINEETIENLAENYHVSREVILRKLLDRELIDQRFYKAKVSEWRKSAKSGSAKGSGGNYYSTQGVYLGEQYVDKVFSKYYQQSISLRQVADYLGVKEKNIPGMENLLYAKGGAS